MIRQEPPYYPYHDDEITLKELLLKLQEFWNEAWRNKFVILLSSLICAGILVAWNMSKPITYTSAITFMVGEAEDNNGAVMLSPFDQVQFEGVKNHKLTEIARSSKIVHQLLLDSTTEYKPVFAYGLLDVYMLRDKWDDYVWEKVDLSSLSVISDSDDSKMVFNKLHELLVGNKLNKSTGKPLLSFSYDDDTEMFNMTVKTIDNELSPALLDKFYTILSDFYIDKTVGIPKRTYKQLKIKEDSLRIRLNEAESTLAYAGDRSRGVVSSVAKVNQSRLQRNLDNLSSQYEEIRANRQKIEYLLQTETPDFQIIDQTFVPILEKHSIYRSSIIGFFIGFLISIIYVSFRQIIRKAMN